MRRLRRTKAKQLPKCAGTTTEETMRSHLVMRSSASIAPLDFTNFQTARLGKIVRWHPQRDSPDPSRHPTYLENVASDPFPYLWYD
jgi:hypothetical protein